MIHLRSSDAEHFEMEERVAIQSESLKYMIQDGWTNGVIPLPNICSRILAKVIEYCRKHVVCNDPAELKAWDAEFVKVDHLTRWELIMAANYLDIQSLLHLTCKLGDRYDNEEDA